MKKFFYKKGFTLIELLVVISIMGMMASVVLAAVNNARQSGSVAAGLRFSGYNFRTLGDQAFGLWDFDEPSGNAIDRSGNRYDGALSVVTRDSFDRPGKGGSSIVIPVSGTPYVNVLTASVGSKNLCSNTDISTGCSSYAMSVWIKPTSFGSATDRYIIEAQNSAIDSGFRHKVIRLGTSAEARNIQCGYGPSGLVSFTEIAMQQDEWQHVACSYDGTSMTLYVNGKAIASKSTTISVAKMSALINRVTIGNFASDSAGTTYSFQGKIDDVAIYNRAITASEAGAIYAQGLADHPLAQAE